MAKCVVRLKHSCSGLFYAMSAVSRISVLSNYSVILIILWAPIGFSVDNDTNLSVTLRPVASTTSSAPDYHPRSNITGTASSHQANILNAKNQLTNDRKPDPDVSNTYNSNSTEFVGGLGQQNDSISSTSASTLSTMLSATTLLPMTTPLTKSSSSSRLPENHNASTVLTLPVHRKSKPEGTHVDDESRDSGPTTDYVVPLVIAMLAVPLVGVLCALLYLKGRDFWERRHYGRIDFLWDNRNDSRMDFLIDGMYNN